MALDYTKFFTILGREEAMCLDLQALRGGSSTARVLANASLLTRWQNAVGSYSSGAASSRLDPLLEGLWREHTAMDQAMQRRQTAAIQRVQQTLCEMVRIDNRQYDGSVATAYRELVRQMIADSKSINASTVSVGAQTSVGSPTGTPVVVASLKDGEGYDMDTCFAEDLLVRCLRDSGMSTNSNTSVSGNAILQDQEEYSVGGEESVGVLDYNWPKGSGGKIIVYGCDSALSNAGLQPNGLYNSDFETTTNGDGNFDNWLIVTGTAGTHIRNGATVYRGSKSLKFVGGATQHRIRQIFNTAPSTTLGAGGTPFLPRVMVPYAMHCRMYVTPVPAAGAVAIRLHDGSAVIADRKGTDNSVTTTISSLADATWTSVSGVFRFPATLASSIYLDIFSSTAISAGSDLFIDSLALTPMKQLYPGGPWIAIFSGATRPVAGDQWTLAVSNDLMAASAASLQKALKRFFDPPSLGSGTTPGMRMPVNAAGAETSADTLVA